MRAGLEKWAEQMINGLADLAVQEGSVYLAAGLRLCSATAWAEGSTENGEPVAITVPFILEFEEENLAFECVDVSAIMDRLDLLYGDISEEEGAKVIPFPTVGTV